MSWDDRYVTATGTDTYANATNPATPCSLATAIAGVGAGDRVNVKAGTYANTTTARTLGGAGTTSAGVWWRGYTTTPGDLDNVPDGTRPEITFTTARCTLGGSRVTLSNLNVSGAATSGSQLLVSGGGCRMDHCRVTATGANAASRAVSVTGDLVATNCYFTTGGTATSIVNVQAPAVLYRCVLDGGLSGIDQTVASALLVALFCVFKGNGQDGLTVGTVATNAVVAHCAFWSATGNGISVTAVQSGNAWLVADNVFASNGGSGVDQSGAANNSMVQTLDNLFYGNGGGTATGLDDSPALGDYADSVTDPVPGAGSGDFAVTRSSPGYGLAHKMENLATTGYDSAGAAEPQPLQPGCLRRTVTHRGPSVWRRCRPRPFLTPAEYHPVPVPRVRPYRVEPFVRRRRPLAMPAPDVTVVKRPRGPVLVAQVRRPRAVYPLEVLAVTANPILSRRRKVWQHSFVRHRSTVCMDPPVVPVVVRPRGPVVVRHVVKPRSVTSVAVTIAPVLSRRHKSWRSSFVRHRSPCIQNPTPVTLVRRPRGPVLVRPVTRHLHPFVNAPVTHVVRVHRLKSWKSLFLRSRSPLCQPRPEITWQVRRRAPVVTDRSVRVRHSHVSALVIQPILIHRKRVVRTAPTARPGRVCVVGAMPPPEPLVRRPRGPVVPPAHVARVRRPHIDVTVIQPVVVFRRKATSALFFRHRRPLAMPAPTVALLPRPHQAVVVARTVRVRRPQVSAVVVSPILIHRRRVVRTAPTARPGRVCIVGALPPPVPLVVRPRGPVVVGYTQRVRRPRVSVEPDAVVLKRRRPFAVVRHVDGPARRPVLAVSRVDVTVRRGAPVSVRPHHRRRRVLVAPAPVTPVVVRSVVRPAYVVRKPRPAQAVIIEPGPLVAVRRKRFTSPPVFQRVQRHTVAVSAPPTTTGPIVARRRSVR